MVVLIETKMVYINKVIIIKHINKNLDGPVKHLGAAGTTVSNAKNNNKDSYDNLVNNRSLTGDQKQWGSAYGGFMNADGSSIRYY